MVFFDDLYTKLVITLKLENQMANFIDNRI